MEGENAYKASTILQAILDNSSDGITLISPEHKILAFNETMHRITKVHFQKEIHLGEDFRNFVAPESEALYNNSFQKAINGETTTVQHGAEFKNKITWYELKFSPLFDKDNNLLGITLYARNIDIQKKAELELERVAQNLEAIIENMEDSVILMDKDYKVMRYNKKVKDRLLKNTNKVLRKGEDFRDYVYSERLELFENMFKEALKGNTKAVEFQIAFSSKRKWLLSRMFPVYKENGELLGVSNIVTNISDRKMAELALKESEEKFRNIVESAPNPILIVDRRMNIILSNPGAEKVFGYTHEELLKKGLEIIFPDDSYSEILEYSKDLDEKSKPRKLGTKDFLTATNKNGKETFIQIDLNKIQINKDDFLLIIILDITERIKAEQKIVSQLKKLENIAWQQSHELRRPVANILGLVNLLKTLPNITEEDKEQYLDYLYKTSEELDTVIQKIVLKAMPEND